MVNDCQGLTREERKLLDQIFREMRKEDCLAPDSEVQERAFQEVLARSVEGLKKEPKPLAANPIFCFQ